MPVGVSVTTNVLDAAGGADTTAAAAFLLSGITERGDTSAPIVARNMTQWQALTGNRVTFGAAYDQVKNYFGEGGSKVIFKRAIGPAATVGTVTVQDVGGSPQNTVRFDAQNAGSWSSTVSVVVAAGIAANTVDISVLVSGAVVEIYPGLASPGAIATALAASAFVRATDLGSTSAAPANNPAAGAYALTAGNSDRTSVDAAALIAALNSIGPEYGPGIVAIPGQPYSTVASGIEAHCVANRRIGAIAAPIGTSVSAAASAARSLRTGTGADSVGFFHPWVKIPDGAGGLLTISPEGFVAGVRARKILAAAAVNGAPMGEDGAGQYTVAAETTLTTAETNTLADAAVNPIRNMLGGVRLYDWRSLSIDEVNWKFLSYRDVVNAVAAELQEAFETFVGRNIDGRGHLFAEMENLAASYLEPLRADGAIYELHDAAGALVDKGYATVTASPVNTAATAAAGQANIQVKVRPSPIGEQINVGIFKASLTTAL